MMVGGITMSKNETDKLDQASTLREKAVRVKKLPPRSELHANKKKKTKWKIHYPMVRLISIAFFLIPIAILALVLSDDNNIISRILPSESSIYEPIHVLKPTPPPAADDDKSDSKETEDKVDEEELKEVITEEQATEPSEQDKEVKEDKAEQENSEPVIDESAIEEDIEIIYHTVQKEETLFSISVKYYNGRHGEKIIKDFNNLITNQVNVGQTLKIPIKKQDS